MSPPRSYGGDPSRVTVLGQSAGAHIAAMGILHQALRRAECPAHAHNGPAPRWSAQKDLERGQRGAAVPTSDGATAPQPYGEVADCPDGAGTGSAPLTLDLHAAGSPAGHSPRGSSPRCNGSPLRAPLLGDDARDGPGTPCYPAGPLSPHGVSALRLGESTSPGKEIRRALFRRSSGPALREGEDREMPTLRVLICGGVCVDVVETCGVATEDERGEPHDLGRLTCSFD